MNNFILKSTFMAVLLLVSASSQAVSFKGSYSAEKNNTVGTKTTPLGKTDANFCYLSKVGFRQLGTKQGKAACAIVTTNGNLQLKATLNNSGGQDASCRAICFKK